MTSGSRDICEVGGLMSYGANIVDSYRQEASMSAAFSRAQAGRLAGRAVRQIGLVINAQTARILGIEISSTLLARADEVIE